MTQPSVLQRAPAEPKNASEPKDPSEADTTRRPGEFPGRPWAARARRLAFLLAGLMTIGALILLVAGQWQDVTRREAYLPDLERQARRFPDDGRLQALVAGRLIEAHEYHAASQALQRATAAGFDAPPVWLTWAAATAADGRRPEAIGVLHLGMRRAALIPELGAAAAREQALPPEAPPVQAAAAICPQGAPLVINAAAPDHRLAVLFDWWGRLHPESSGFATRQTWARQRADDAQAQRLWGLGLLRNRRVQEAELPLRRAVRLAPRSPPAHLALGDFLYAEGAPAKAGMEYSECLKLRPAWLPALLRQGRVSHDLDLVALTVDLYQQATQRAPRSVEAWVGLGRARLRTYTQFGGALAAFQTAARLAPQRSDFDADYAQALLATAHWDQAETVLRARLARAPEDAAAHYLLAQLLSENRPSPPREAEAERELRAALRWEPHMPAAEIELSQILLRRGALSEAVSLLGDALDRDPYNVEALTMVGRAYQMAGQPEKAQAIFALATKTSASNQRLAFAEDEEHRRPLAIKTHLQLAALYAGRHQMDRANRERAMVGALRARPQAAAHGLTALAAAASASSGAASH